MYAHSQLTDAQVKSKPSLLVNCLLRSFKVEPVPTNALVSTVFITTDVFALALKIGPLVLLLCCLYSLTTTSLATYFKQLAPLKILEANNVASGACCPWMTQITKKMYIC